MNRLWILLLSGVFWALMMTLLVEREVIPYFEYMSAPTYRTLLRDKLEPEVRKLHVFYLVSTKVGEMETLVRPGKDGGWVMETRVSMELQMGNMPVDTRYVSRSETVIDRNYKIVSIHTDGRALGLLFVLDGRRNGEMLDIAYECAPFMKGTRSVKVDDDAMIGDSFTPYLGGGRLWKGKKWSMQIVDVMSLLSQGSSKGELETKTVYAEVAEQESLKWHGRDVLCFLVHVRTRWDSENPTHAIWVTDDGNVLSTRYYLSKEVSYEFRLDEKRKLTVEEAEGWKWSLPAPKGTRK